jgi:8-oxo-dGTP pyrophosphatase MutT (NUDIX family)
MQDRKEKRKGMDKLKDRIDHLVDDWATHSESFHRTGFWGAFGGAGGIFLARDTGRLLLARRSSRVLQPGTWGTVGGALDHGESPEEAVIRETREELGIHPRPEDLHLCHIFRDEPTRFVYYNYTVLVTEEFQPELNWEVSEHAWVEFGSWPDPLHFGMLHWLRDPHGAQKLRTLVQRFTKGG